MENKELRKQTHHNIYIDVKELNNLEWKLLERLYPNAVSEIRKFFTREYKVTLEESVWLDNRELYDFFDLRDIILYVQYNTKHKKFSSRCSDFNHFLALNELVYFDDRFYAETTCLLHGMKIREKEIKHYLKNT